jgi:membrane-associated phospholipid phosphatase
MDGSLYRFVNRLADRSAFAQPVVVAYAKYGLALFAVLLVTGWWQARRAADRRSIAAVLWGGTGALVALGAAQLIGQLIDRARPYAVMPTAHVLIDRTSDFSFPSDHATAVGAVAAGLWLANRRFGLWAGGLALLMAFSRVYVGAHYPGDVVGGLLVGSSVVIMLWPVASRILDPVLKVVGATPLAVLLSRTSPPRRGRTEPGTRSVPSRPGPAGCL